MDPELNKRPLGPTSNANNRATPTPLGNFDFDREIDEPPANPGPLLQQKPRPSKPGGGAKTFIMVLLTILLLAAVGAAGYFYWQNSQLQNQVSQKDSQISTLTTDNSKLKSDADKANAKDEEPTETLTQKEQASLIAGQYACSAVLEGTNTCDKAVKEVKKIQEFKANPATMGFAIVHVSDATKKVLMKVLLKSHDGVSWSVVYEGEAVPTDIAKKFVVPTDFVNLAQ